MPQPSAAQIRLQNVAACLTITANTLEIIADSLNTPFLGAIVATTRSVLENIEVGLCQGSVISI